MQSNKIIEKMLRISIVIMYFLTCLKWGDWKRWKEFYPTILFVIIGDFSYNFIYYNYTLWKYQGLINHTVSDLIIAVIVFPCAIILFLTYWPKGLIMQVLYILLWSAVNTAIEFVSVLTRNFSYDNGWSILWSAWVFVCGFTLVRVHYRHPLATWLISGALSLFVAIVFKLPIAEIK